MANELNKNRDDREDKLGNPSNDGVKGDVATKYPIDEMDVNNTKAANGQIPGVKPNQSGRQGSVSSEDGGQHEGSSAGSH